MSVVKTPAGPLVVFGAQGPLVSGLPTKADAPRGDPCRDWPASTRQASFKGIPFEVSEDTMGGGRRISPHQYPNRDTYDIEDLGRELITYSVSAYVIGPDADMYRDALYEKCSAEAGPGPLVLPLARRLITAWLVKVQCTNVYDEMGRIPIQLEFIEHVEPRGGLFSSVYHLNVIKQRSDDSAKAINEVFSEAFDTVIRGFSDINFVPAAARTTAANEIVNVAGALANALVGVTVLDPRAGAQINYNIRRMHQTARYLAYRGQRPNRYEVDTFIADQVVIRSGLSACVSDTCALLTEFGASPEAVYGSLFPLTSYQAEPIPRAQSGVSRSERAETVLTQEVANLLRRHALVRMAEASARRLYKTRQDAAQAKADIAQAFQNEILQVLDVRISEPLEWVMGGAVDFLTQTADLLPSTVRMKAPPALPAVVAAYALYKDAQRAGDLIELNGKRMHPLFMPQVFDAPLDLGGARRASG